MSQTTTMQNNMIQIHGLTPRQKQVIDLLWNCRSLEQAVTLVKALPTHKDRCDAHSLLNMVALESIEQEEGLEAYADAAAAAISSAQR